MSEEFDVIVIGGGVVGCALSWYLAHFDLRVLLLEKELDVCSGVSKANTGIIHSRSYWTPHTLKGEVHLRSLPWIKRAEKELDIEFLKTGALTVAFSQDELEFLRTLKERGKIEGAEILTPQEAHTLEPMMSDKMFAAYYDPETRVASPFKLNIALAEGAFLNGVRFIFGQEVVGFEEGKNNNIKVITKEGEYLSRFALNCAGLSSSYLAQRTGENIPSLQPLRGEYLVLDKECKSLVHHVLYPVPVGETKGILVSPTTDGNILVGPNLEPAEDEDTSTTKEGLKEVEEGGKKLIPSLPLSQVIATFSGLRPTLPARDFQIFFSSRFPSLLHLVGIESPGLTASFGIAEYAGDLLQKKGLKLREKRSFLFRSSFPVFRELSWEERERLIQEDADWGKIICRCEEVTVREVKHALLSSPGASTLDGLKRRVRVMMGRCQGSFCGMHLPFLMAETLGLEERKIIKSGRNSFYLGGETKEVTSDASFY
ncbi:MAG TPA: NAD(P)/FAD-dependent oxidoreductase [Candidatus Atribacteria bacterium]|nr:NAD(P)/FAD-dependent oxidoreductase [Candidatus Atribacteria bacterium]